MMHNPARWRRVSLVCAALLVVVGCRLLGRVNAITVSEIGACRDYDRDSMAPIDPTAEFPADARRLMIYFYAKTGLEDAAVTYQWYFEDEPIGESVAPLDPGYNFGWIVLENPEKERFPPGEYRVDILLGEGLLRSTGFQVLAP